jgi:HK97 family phage prohead protease
MKTKQFNSDLQVNRDKREVLAIISTDDPDRDAEVVLPSGLRTSGINYSGRPICWSHNKQLLPVGSLLWIKPQDNNILAKFRISDKTQDANDVYGLIEDGTLSAVSIGFEVFGERPISELDLQSRPDWVAARNIITDFEIIELSVCSVPANPNARIIDKSLDDDCWQYDTKAITSVAELSKAFECMTANAITPPAIPTPRYARKIDLDKVIAKAIRRHDANELIARIKGKA